ncbi:Tripartite motif-containing protein 3 [Mizuhopecten yessoensis]|uniref:Tripartite motif-containing protein 3 n=1 Tax=Mizuhopecten yessoensis TaxID=6573 RepID=A0A210R4U9_MIZYE|nr:Tripartite motif-containing protein 3 [Mizuhopecten yessoensis]
MEGDAVRAMVTCPICRNTKKFPKKLRCQHSFCAACIANYMCSFTGKASFSCPVCQDSNTCVNDTVDITDSFQLPEDVFIQKLCDCVNSPASESATSDQLECPMHPGETASHFCIQCAVGVCKDCRSENHQNDSCQLVNLQDGSEAIQQASKQKSQTLKYSLGQMAVELCGIESTLQSKENDVLSSKDLTTDKVKAYYAELLEKVTHYLQEQEQKVLSHLEVVIKKETDCILQRLVVTSSMLTSLQRRKNVLANIIENTGEVLSQAESLNLQMHMMNNVSEYRTVMQDLKSVSLKDLTLRFMINTDLEDMLTESDLVKIELVNSCHSAPVPAMFETHNISSPENQSFLSSQQSSLSETENRPRVRRSNSAESEGRSDNSRLPSVRSESSERRTGTKERRPKPSPYTDTGRQSQNRSLRPPTRGPRTRPKSPQNIPDDIGPPPPYSPNLIEIDPPTSRRQNRRPRPSAPPLQAQQQPGTLFTRPPPVAMTIPKVGVLVPHERAMPQITQKIANVQYQSMLDCKAEGDTRTPRIIGIAVIGRRLILADKWNNNLKVITKDFRRIEQVVACHSFQPWDIASYAVGRCVVAAPKEKILAFVGRARHTSQIQVVGKINVAASYASITYFERENNFICGICPPYGGPSIDILNTSGVVLKSFKSDSFGKPLFTYPRNISVTDEGTIVVCDLDTRSAILVNADNGMYKMFSGNEQVQLQDPQCVEVLESHQLVLVLNSKFRKLIALSFSGEVIQQVDDVPILDNARRVIRYGNNLVFVHQDGAVTFYTFE